MILDAELFERLCRLARLHLGKEETKRLAGELERIVQFVATFEEIDASIGSIPSAEAVSIEQLREDCVLPGTDRDIALSVAPETEDGEFVVPSVIPSPDPGDEEPATS